MDTSSSAQWPSVTVTSPLQIEFPRSLVEVVINWNVPMHTWLKTCNIFTILLHLNHLNFSLFIFQ